METLPPLYERVQPTREVIERARRMSPGQKMLEGGTLFDRWVERCGAILRRRHPLATEQHVGGILRRHIEEERLREYAQGPGPYTR